LKALFTIDGGFGTPISAADDLSDAPMEIEARAEDISNLLFTGGTTGRPKGVALRHGSIVTAYTQSLAFWDWPQEVRFLIATPISHAAAAMLTPPSIPRRSWKPSRGRRSPRHSSSLR
jgi:fatty-acyl-CoA synthase